MLKFEASETEPRTMLRKTRDDEDLLPLVEWDEQQSSLRVFIQFLNRELWSGRKKWISFLASSYIVFGPVSNLFLLDLWDRAFPHSWVNNFLGLHNIITTLVLFTVHLCSSELKLWPLLLLSGIFIGLLFGPLYIIITRFARIRYSEKWHHIT